MLYNIIVIYRTRDLFNGTLSKNTDGEIYQTERLCLLRYLTVRLADGLFHVKLRVFRDALFVWKGQVMEQENRVAIISMIISDEESVPAVNAILHEYGKFIQGRMGLPYRERGLNIISVVVDAPADTISTISGKLGRLRGVTSKSVYSKEKTG